MARYLKDFPMVDTPENTYGEITRYLISQKFVPRNRDGENLFQKGKGFWVAPSFVKVTYFGNIVRLEAWIDAFGEEQGLDGFVGVAAKKPLKKVVACVEQILQRPGVGFVPEEYRNPAVDTQSFASPHPETVQAMPASKKEYFQKYAGESFYMNLRVNAILGYILCGLSLMSLLINPYAIFDTIIYLALVLGMHLGKSKGCAIVITIYAAIWMVVGLIQTGALAGWGWLIVGIYSWILFHNAEKRYRKMVEKA